MTRSADQEAGQMEGKLSERDALTSDVGGHQQLASDDAGWCVRRCRSSS